jgi:hypothetical protein
MHSGIPMAVRSTAGIVRMFFVLPVLARVVIQPSWSQAWRPMVGDSRPWIGSGRLCGSADLGWD